MDARCYLIPPANCDGYGGFGEIAAWKMSHCGLAIWLSDLTGTVGSFTLPWSGSTTEKDELPMRIPAFASPLGWSLLLATTLVRPILADDPWVVYQGKSGPGQGKHIVFVTGDDEYRSEEGMPMLAKILAVRHGFKCTVLFAIHPDDGTITPSYQNNIPGLEALATADMMVMFLRFRELPDEQMRHIVDYVNSGKPILGLRTATHAFNYQQNKTSPFASYSFDSQDWRGGFGQQVLGDTWISHHGHHGQESTRGILNPLFKDHPILRGVDDIWGPTDVYGIQNLPKDAQVLVHGQVLAGMKPSDPPVVGAKNDPMMPLFWLRERQAKSGKMARIACTTMGASTDLESAGLRRLLINTCYWGLGLDDKISEQANVDYVGPYHPTQFGFGSFQKGIKPAEHALDE